MYDIIIYIIIKIIINKNNKMFSLGNKKSFGIDIGTQTIKIVEVVKNNNSVRINNYSIWEENIENIIQKKGSNDSLSTQQITNIMDTMLNKSGMNISEAYIALPSCLSFFSIISMPIMDFSELESAIPFEAKKNIPVSFSSIQLDWINLGKNQEQDKYNILIIAIPNNIINRYIEISKSLGIKIKGFELDCFSIIRSINIPKEVSCVLDIGARNSTLMIVNSDKKLQAIQSFDFGGSYITDLISKLKSISTMDAEILKIKNGINKENNNVSDIIQDKFNTFINNDVIRFIKDTQDKMKLDIKNLILVGGTVKMIGLKDLIEKNFRSQFSNQNISISTSSSDETINIKGISDKNKVETIWQDLILSTGVALKNYIE